MLCWDGFLAQAYDRECKGDWRLWGFQSSCEANASCDPSLLCAGLLSRFAGGIHLYPKAAEGLVDLLKTHVLAQGLLSW